MADEFEGQAPDQTPAEVTGETPAQAIDYAALEQQAKTLGDGITLSNLPDQHRAAIKGMNDAQTEFANYKKQYGTAALLQDQINSDPRLGDFLTTQIKEFYEEGGTSAPKEVSQAVSPDSLRLHNIETQLQDQAFFNEIRELRSKYGKEALTEDVERQINERIAASGFNDPKAHFLSIVGETLIAKREQEASKQTAEQIAKNTDAYNLHQGSHAPTSKPYDSAKATEEEWSEALDADLDKMMGDGAV